MPSLSPQAKGVEAQGGKLIQRIELQQVLKTSASKSPRLLEKGLRGIVNITGKQYHQSVSLLP